VRQQVLATQFVQQVLAGVGALVELVGAQHDVEVLALQQQPGFLHPASGLHLANAASRRWAAVTLRIIVLPSTRRARARWISRSITQRLSFETP
jgi:hypothetical protein